MEDRVMRCLEMRDKPGLKALAVLFAIVMVSGSAGVGSAIPYPANMDAI
jgi:hypothetical protein